MMQREKDFGMWLMRRDFWSGLRKLHKDYRHPARVGCDTYERAFKIVRLKVYHRPIGGIEMVGLKVCPPPVAVEVFRLYNYNLYRVMFDQLEGKCIA